jgi:hypothetical protein
VCIDPVMQYRYYRYLFRCFSKWYRILLSHAYFNIHFTVLDRPTTLPKITQKPVGPINEGNKVTLTCTIQGANRVTTITWSCEGANQIIPTGSPSTEDTISSVELVTSKDNNGQICPCTGRHILWANDKTQQHTITVYCKYKI